MPKWGLSKKQRAGKPWGLSEDILKPDKTITDPVHGDIYITKLERLLLDSPPMQRLRRIRQLGTTHLVYPGATHSRFSHTLGALRVAQNLLDAVVEQRYGPNPVGDLFAQWEKNGSDEYDKKVAEATVLARLGTLLHDICHIPFGHSIEDDCGILEAHDKNITRYEKLWSKIPTDVQGEIPDKLREALRPLILSKESGSNSNAPYPFVADIVGNTICADLLDYLPRDHLFSGLPAKLGHRFVDYFYVTDKNHVLFPERMAIKINMRGKGRADIISELLKFLRYRYELSERALVHHAKVAADAMIGKALEIWYDAIWLKKAHEICENKKLDISSTRNEIKCIRELLKKESISLLKEADNFAKYNMENEFLLRGDDGLLEHMYSFMDNPPFDDKRFYAIGSLAEYLINRKLYKRISYSSNRVNAKETHNRFNPPSERRTIERNASDYAGLRHSWQVLLWIPDPNMRLKAAEVLVDEGDLIAPLHGSDHHKRGEEIYENHKALWGVSVFIHPSLENETREILLAWFGKTLGIKWDNLDQRKTLTQIAVSKIGNERGLSRQNERKIVDDLSDMNPLEYSNFIDFFNNIKERVRTYIPD